MCCEERGRKHCAPAVAACSEAACQPPCMQRALRRGVAQHMQAGRSGGAAAQPPLRKPRRRQLCAVREHQRSCISSLRIQIQTRMRTGCFGGCMGCRVAGAVMGRLRLVLSSADRPYAAALG
jgi:hypothetical protein